MPLAAPAAFRRARRRTLRILSAAVAAGSTVFAGAPQATDAANVTRGCVERYDAARDYFPDKATVEDALNYRVTYHLSHKVVSVSDVDAAGPVEHYVLVQCGAPVPPLAGDLAGAQVVTVPVSSLYAASTTHLQPLADLDRLDVLTGVSVKRYVVGDAILARTRRADVREFAPISVVDTELVVSGRPGLFMTGGPATAELAVLRNTGIPVVANNEWLEPTALARAEWLKYIALFLNEERTAQRLYGDMKTRYAGLRARATAIPDAARPLVMTGRGTRGDFVIAGGRSYVAALIHDAGGRYVWADNTARGSVTIDLEAQVRRAAGADIWINGGGWRSLAEMVTDEPRYAAFTPYRTGQVWVYERRVTPDGANDYWSRAVSHPDLILADLVKIFHPQLAASHQFEWYMQVPAR